MPRFTTGKGRHVSYNDDGELCMTVVDPVTRKLLVPTQYIFETRAQQRGTLPSLCQLFLSGRCRQGRGCYQVHADWDAVQRLRAQVDSLPCCCPAHGDKDHLGVTEGALLRDTLGPHLHPHHATSVDGQDGAADSVLCACNVVLYVPGCSVYQGSYVPLERVSYTVGLRRLLEDQQVLHAAPEARVSLLNAGTGFPEDKVVADASQSTVCRLHAMDRCRYAEECKFLHLCKELTTADPHLTASPADNGADSTCAAAEASFDASITSGGISAATTLGASMLSPERRGKSQQGSFATAASAAAPARQSVFTSISIQQQQQQCYHHHTHLSQPQPAQPASLGMMGGNRGVRPLLVPQCEAAAATQACTAPLLSKSLTGYRSSSTAGTVTASAANAMTPPPSAMPLHADPHTTLDPHLPTTASTGSFPGSLSYGSHASMPQHVYAAGNGRIRVSLSLPALQFMSNANSTAALGTSNSSDKSSTTPTEESLGNAGREPSLLHNANHGGLARTEAQNCSSSSLPSRWHHNPYMSFMPKSEVPTVGSCGSFSGAQMHCSPNGLLYAMTR